METDEYKQLASENKMEMSAAEEEALAEWMLNPDAYTNTSMDDLEGESVPAREGPPTHEQRREVMGGNAPGTIDGFAGLFAAGFDLVYYLTIDDAVVLLDPNSTPDERLIAGFFLIPTPGKFAKPFLKHADDVGGAINKARKTEKVVNVNNKKVIETATTPKKGGETVVGHALQKHAGRILILGAK